MIRASTVAITIVMLAGCSLISEPDRVVIYTISYPPYTHDDGTGLFIDIVTEAYKTQGVEVEFKIHDLETAYQTAKTNKALMLGSREYVFENEAPYPFYTEVYQLLTSLISIKGNPHKNILGVFSEDEVIFAKQNGLSFKKYSEYKKGLNMLYQNEVDQVFCSGISCDQIMLSNPNLEFELETAYEFPVDMVYYGKTLPAHLKNQLELLEKGLNILSKNGRYMDLLLSYKVETPVFKIPLNSLMEVEIRE